MMIFGRVLQLLLRRPQVLTIDLVARDRMALGMKIVNLTDEQCAALDWSQIERKKLFQALMARSPKGYDGWHPTDERLSAATLALSEWKMIERLCLGLVSTEGESWPLRVSNRIRAKEI